MNDTAQEDTPQRVEATATRDTLVRLGILATLMVAGGLWFGYDGYIAKGGFDLTGMGDPEANPAVRDLAKEQGKQIPGKYDYKPRSEDLNIWLTWATNHYAPFVLIPVGLALGVMAVMSTRHSIVADTDGLTVNGKTKIPWDTVTGLDATNLKNKQILYVEHGDGGQLKVDGYKVNSFRDLVAAIEKGIPESARPEPDTSGPAEAGDQADPES